MQNGGPLCAYPWLSPPFSDFGFPSAFGFALIRI